MKGKTVIVLLIAAGLLALVAHRTARRPAAAGQEEPGGLVLKDLPLNEIAKITLRGPDQTVTLAPVEGTWRVAERFNYPADFDKLRRALRELIDLKVGQLVRLDPARWTELQLTPESGGHVVELAGEGGRTLASLVVGRAHMRKPAGGEPGGGYPDGRYVASGERAYLVSETLDIVREGPRDWLQQRFLDVQAGDLALVTVEGPGREPIRLSRAEGQADWTLEATPAGRTLDAADVNRLAGALSYMSFADVADPSLPPAETGLDAPVRFTASTPHGVEYALSIGSATNEGRRFLAVAVTVPPDPPAAPAVTNEPAAGTNGTELADDELKKTEDEARRKELADAREVAAMVRGWVYLVDGRHAETLTLKKDDLLAEPAAATNVAGTAAAEALAEP